LEDRTTLSAKLAKEIDDAKKWIGCVARVDAKALKEGIGCHMPMVSIGLTRVAEAFNGNRRRRIRNGTRVQ